MRRPAARRVRGGGLLLLSLLLLLLASAPAPALAQTPDPRPSLQLDLLDAAPSMAADPTYIYFEAGATSGLDSQYDATKLPNSTGLNVASFTSAGPRHQLVINGLPPYVAGTPLAIDLFVGVPSFGRFRFRLSRTANFGGTRFALLDRLLGVSTPLVMGGTYAFDMTFANTAGRYNDPGRFALEIMPPGDLVVRTATPPPLGYYRNITITATGLLQLDKDVEVTGTCTVQAGGLLDTGDGAAAGYVLRGNAFVLEAGGRIVVTDPVGIAATAARGNVQTSARSFSPDGLYTYAANAGAAGPAAVTGDGLPATVRYLGAAVQTPNVPGTLRLSQPLNVTQNLELLTNLDTDGQALVLKSSPAGPTAIVGRIEGTLTGTLTQERAIDPALNAGAGYRHFSNPFSSSIFGLTAGPAFVPVVNAAYNTSATPNLVTPFPNLYTYDFAAVANSPATTYSAFDRGWRALAPGDAAPARGQGFIAHMSAANVLRFAGTLHEVAQAVPLPANPTPGPAWVLLGNPFTAPLDGTALGRPASVPAAFYVFETTGPYAGRYRATVNGQGASVLIPTGQAFFMSQSAGAAAATLTVPLAARRAVVGTAVPTLRRPVPDLRPRLALTLAAPGTAPDDLILYAEAGATPAFDPALDAYKLPSPGQAELAALTPSGEALSIGGLPRPVAAGLVVPLRLALPRAGGFTLAVAPANFNGLEAWLLDAQTGLRHSLRAPGALAFAATTAGPLASRFAVQWGGAAAPLAAGRGALAAALGLYPNPAHGTATVLVPAWAGGGPVLAVLHDALGREVRRQTAPATAAGAAFVLNLNGLPAGVYALEVAAGGQVATRRLVVE